MLHTQKLHTTFFLFIISTVGFSQSYNIDDHDGGTITGCSGTLYDSGGAGGNYSNDEDYEVTICPDNPGDAIYLDFTQFDIEDDADCSWDWINIYDGTGTGGSSLTGGILCGTQTGLNFTSTDADGCITIVFHSDGIVNEPGFAATISCVTACQTPTAALSDETDLTFCSPDATNSAEPYTVNVDGSSSTVGTYLSGSHSIDEYVWNWGDGTTSSTSGATSSHDYSTPGVYTIELVVNDDNTDVNPDGCPSTNEMTQTIYVAPTPEIQATGASTSCGDCVDIEAVATSQTEASVPPSPTITPTILPDDAGSCFTNAVDYTGYFPNGATVSSSCYPTICIDIDHTYAGDLEFNLIAPSGESVTLYSQDWGGFPQYYLLGDCSPTDDDEVAGCPRTYCFVNSGGTDLGDATDDTGDTGCCTDGEAGDYVTADTYNSLNPFSALDGADMNGTWALEVCDLIASDDGTLHSWDISFPTSCYTVLNETTPDISSITWSPDGAESSFSESTSSTAVFGPGPDACPSGETCEGNEINSTANVCYSSTTSGTFTYDYTIEDEYGCQFDGSVDITVACLLSVELLAFEGTSERNYNLLTWKTLTENNNDYFNLQRSNDLTHWETIASIDGAGNSSEELNYGYKDYNYSPNALNYYRLQQVDFDNTTSTSETIVIDNDVQSESLVIFPNPTTGKATIKFHANTSGESQIKLLDARGRVIINKSMPSKIGSNAFSMDLSYISQGIYTVEVASNTEVMVSRVIKK